MRDYAEYEGRKSQEMIERSAEPEKVWLLFLSHLILRKRESEREKRNEYKIQITAHEAAVVRNDGGYKKTERINTNGESRVSAASFPGKFFVR